MADETERLLQHHRLLLESRENAHMFAFMQHYGAEAEDLIRKTYYEHGLANGKKALRHLGPNDRDVKAVVEILHRWVIGGLSAEKKVNWVEATERRVVIRSVSCAHMAAWKDAGVPTDKACDLYKAWIDGFTHAFNPKIRHYKNSRVSAGDGYCEEVWELPVAETG